MRQIEAIIQKYPEFESKSYEIKQSGQNNIIIIFENDEIFRCPRHEVNRLEMMKEYQTLSILENQVQLQIPKIKYYNLEGTIDELFLGYDYIKGEVLHQSMLEHLSLPALGKALSMFLYQLHDENIKIKLKPYLIEEDAYGYWMDMYNRIRKQLMPLMHEEKKKEVQEDFEAILSSLQESDFKTTVIHGDFGLSNILINKEDSKVTGIIDFGSLAIGDPAVDIASLIGPFGFQKSFIEDHFIHYPEAKNYIQRAILYTKSFALQEALYGYENNDQRALEAGMKNYV